MELTNEMIEQLKFVSAFMGAYHKKRSDLSISQTAINYLMSVKSG
jgi:hypothetical protein